MSFESFIAKRYLLSKHKINFITIISFISIIGITIGVAALIVVLSVFNGFGSLVSSYLMNLDPHIRIEARSLKGENQIDLVRRELSSIKEVVSFSPFVDGKVLAYNKGITQVVNLKGITEESASRVYNLEPTVVLGELNIRESKNVLNIIIGLKLADKLQVITGDTLTLISPVGIERALTQFAMPLTKKCVIKGIFNSNNNDYDAAYLFTNVKNAQSLLGFKNSYQGYEARLIDIDQAFKVRNSLQQKLNKDDFSINTWYDFHKELYSVMQIERWTAYIILSLIIAVATFNILGSLSMSVIEK